MKKTDKCEVSRRFFLKGSAAAALLAAAHSVVSFAEEAPAMEEEMMEASETYEADVVIVGAGAAGLQAALQLTKAGRSVIILEKGGSAAVANFALCGGPTACETKLQEEAVSLATFCAHLPPSW